MVHAPRKIVAINLADEQSVGVTVHQGASGTVDAASTMPWAVRLEKSLAVCEASKAACVVVLDAPPTAEISSARVAMALMRTRMAALKGTEKLLIMASKPHMMYPYTNMSPDGTPRIRYSTKPWHKLQQAAEWGATVELLHDTELCRMQDTFALLLGSHRVPSGPHVSTAAYPVGHCVPKEALKYIRFSDNVISGSARASLTRGVTANTTDGASWTATVIMQCDDGTEESDLARNLRVMLTSSDTRKVGSAYFALCAMGSALPPWVRCAMQDVHTHATVSVTPTAPVPLCRVASIHSPWH